MPSSTGSDRARCAADRGQASVEFVLALPIVVLMSVGLLLVGVAVRNELAVELAAREGARAASVSANPAAAATRAANRATALPIDVAITSAGRSVAVTVTYGDPVDVAGGGALIGRVSHAAAATMVLDPPEAAQRSPPGT